MTTVLITGGGTAGHTNPGIAVAEALVELGLQTGDVHFVGAERGNEGQLVPEAGFSIDLLPGRGIVRSLSLPSLRQNASSVIGLLRGLGQAMKIVRRRRPDVVMCLGGYASFAASMAAVVQRVPLVVSEQNARASAVNRLFGRFATVCALPYPDTDLPRGELTGNPIRSSIVASVQRADKASARSALGLSQDRVIIAVWAGSLGSRSINQAVEAMASAWSDNAGLEIYHVIGRRDWDSDRDAERIGGTGGLNYRVVEYENRMPQLLAAADVAICRGGASTAAELAVAGLPAILVPLPSAPRDHQRANGKELVDAGGAIHVDDAALTDHALLEPVAKIVEDPELRTQMSTAALSVSRPDAANSVASILLREATPQTKGAA